MQAIGNQLLGLLIAQVLITSVVRVRGREGTHKDSQEDSWYQRIDEEESEFPARPNNDLLPWGNCCPEGTTAVPETNLTVSDGRWYEFTSGNESRRRRSATSDVDEHPKSYSGHRHRQYRGRRQGRGRPPPGGRIRPPPPMGGPVGPVRPPPPRGPVQPPARGSPQNPPRGPVQPPARRPVPPVNPGPGVPRRGPPPRPQNQGHIARPPITPLPRRPSPTRTEQGYFPSAKHAIPQAQGILQQHEISQEQNISQEQEAPQEQDIPQEGEIPQDQQFPQPQETLEEQGIPPEQAIPQEQDSSHEQEIPEVEAILQDEETPPEQGIPEEEEIPQAQEVPQTQETPQELEPSPNEGEAHGKQPEISRRSLADSYMSWAAQFMPELSSTSAETTTTFSPTTSTARSTIVQGKQNAMDEYLSWAEKVLSSSSPTTMKPPGIMGPRVNQPVAAGTQPPQMPIPTAPAVGRGPYGGPRPPPQQQYQQNGQPPRRPGGPVQQPGVRNGYNPGRGPPTRPESNQKRPTAPQRQKNTEFFGNGAYGRAPAAPMPAQPSLQPPVVSSDNNFFNNPAYESQQIGSSPAVSSSTQTPSSTIGSPVSEESYEFFSNPAYGNRPAPSPSPPVKPSTAAPAQPQSAPRNNEFFNNPAYGVRPVPLSPATEQAKATTTRPSHPPSRNNEFFNNPAYGIQPSAPSESLQQGSGLQPQNQPINGHGPYFRPQQPMGAVEGNGPAGNLMPYPGNPQQFQQSSSIRPEEPIFQAESSTENTEFFNNPAYGIYPSRQTPSAQSSRFGPAESNFEYPNEPVYEEQRSQQQPQQASAESSTQATTTELNWFDYEKYGASPTPPPQHLSKEELMAIWRRNMAAVEATSVVPATYVTVPRIVDELDQLRYDLASSTFAPSAPWQPNNNPQQGNPQYQQPNAPSTYSMDLYFNHPAYAQNHPPPGNIPQTAALTAHAPGSDYDLIQSYYRDKEGMPLKSDRGNARYYETEEKRKKKGNGSVRQKLRGAIGSITHYISSGSSSQLLMTPSSRTCLIVTTAAAHLSSVAIAACNG